MNVIHVLSGVLVLAAALLLMSRIETGERQGVGLEKDDIASNINPISSMPKESDEDDTKQVFKTDSKSKEALQNGIECKIHWRTKLPAKLASGNHVFKSERDFATFLGEHAEKYLEWNAIDFRKQMAIVVVQVRGDIGKEVKINSVCYCEKEVVVFVEYTPIQDGEMDVAAIISETSGVVINRMDLPVRFTYFAKQDTR